MCVCEQTLVMTPQQHFADIASKEEEEKNSSVAEGGWSSQNGKMSKRRKSKRLKKKKKTELVTSKNKGIGVSPLVYAPHDDDDNDIDERREKPVKSPGTVPLEFFTASEQEESLPCPPSPSSASSFFGIAKGEHEEEEPQFFGTQQFRDFRTPPPPAPFVLINNNQEEDGDEDYHSSRAFVHQTDDDDDDDGDLCGVFYGNEERVVIIQKDIVLPDHHGLSVHPLLSELLGVSYLPYLSTDQKENLTTVRTENQEQKKEEHWTPRSLSNIFGQDNSALNTSNITNNVDDPPIQPPSDNSASSSSTTSSTSIKDTALITVTEVPSGPAATTNVTIETGTATKNDPSILTQAMSPMTEIDDNRPTIEDNFTSPRYTASPKTATKSPSTKKPVTGGPVRRIRNSIAAAGKRRKKRRDQKRHGKQKKKQEDHDDDNDDLIDDADTSKEDSHLRPRADSFVSVSSSDWASSSFASSALHMPHVTSQTSLSTLRSFSRGQQQVSSSPAMNADEGANSGMAPGERLRLLEREFQSVRIEAEAIRRASEVVNRRIEALGREMALLRKQQQQENQLEGGPVTTSSSSSAASLRSPRPSSSVVRPPNTPVATTSMLGGRLSPPPPSPPPPSPPKPIRVTTAPGNMMGRSNSFSPARRARASGPVTRHVSAPLPGDNVTEEMEDVVEENEEEDETYIQPREAAEEYHNALDVSTEGLPIDDFTAPKVRRWKEESDILLRVHDVQTPETSSSSSDILSLYSQDAPLVVDRIVAWGYQCATNYETKWTATRDTERTVTKLHRSSGSDEDVQTFISRTFHPKLVGKDVFVWHSKMERSGYGSDLPVVKARGLIQTTAKNLYDLLIDSNRVKEYNKISLGRTDEFQFCCFNSQEENNNISTECNKENVVPHWRGDVKIIRSLSKPPIIRKPVELLCLMCGRPLTSQENRTDSGYVLMTRSIWESEDEVPDSKKSSKSSKSSAATTIRSEMLLGFNLIRDAGDGWCEMTAVTHVYSPAAPMMLAKSIGLSAASNFIRDLQVLYEK